MNSTTIPLLMIRPASARTHAMPAWKRGLDLLCGLLALPLLAVAALVMTVITRLVSPGPVLFRQERIGYRGNRFNILKFRTMTVNADTAVHEDHFKEMRNSNAPMVKLDAQGDSRLIPGGWLLRASGLDELPQFLNVLIGDMSLVGPRPCLPSEYAQYLPAQRERVDAVPGLTGLWQVSGKNRRTFAEMIRLDIQYARQVSLSLDLMIIVLTPWALIVQMYDTYLRRRSSAPALPASVSRPFLSSPSWTKPWQPGLSRPPGRLLVTAFSTGPDVTRTDSAIIAPLKS